MSSGGGAPLARLGASALLLSGLVAATWLMLQAAPEGPQPVAFDRVRCARCGMLVSEPRFAAQLHTPAGDVLHFDDPGCLLLHREVEPEARVWFRDATSERWLAEAEARFAPMTPTPMGYGLGAVPADVPNAIGVEAARAHVVALEAERGGARVEP